MPENPLSREKALVDLLLALFAGLDELRKVHRYDYRDIVREIPWQEGLRGDAHDLVLGLVRAGAVQHPPNGDVRPTRAYFEFLLEEREQARPRIAAVAAEWGVHELGRSPTGERRGLHGPGLTRFAQWIANALSMPAMTQLVRTYLGHEAEARVTARAVSPLAHGYALLMEVKREPERGELLVAALARSFPQHRAEIEAHYGPLSDVDLTPDDGPGPTVISVGQEQPGQEQPPDDLRRAQRELYRFLDELGVDCPERLDRFTAEERHVISHKLLDRVIGRGVPEEQLLDACHMNLRFDATDLVQAIDPSRLDTMHRKTAIYGDHSLAVVTDVTLERMPGVPARPSMAIDAGLIAVLLRYRPLVEHGKMSIVPRKVFEVTDRPREMFSVDRIDAAEVDVRRADFRAVYMREGRPNRRVGVITVDMPRGGALPIEDVLEIEDVFRAEYETFQHTLRGLLDNIRHEDVAQQLFIALREVEAGIQALDAKFERGFRAPPDLPGEIAATGRLIIQIYGDSPGAERLLRDGVGQGSRSVKFYGVDEAFALNLQSDKYFVPWLLSQVRRDHG